MRVLVVLVLAALTTVAHSESDRAANSYRSQTELAPLPTPEAQSFIPFWKKKRNKKAKTSNRLKKHNKRMGKNFRRKNNDSLRRD